MNRAGGSLCPGGIFFLHRATGVHELRQQYALYGRQVFRLNQAGTCADAARAHKRVDTYGFHPLVNHPFPKIVWRRPETGDRFEKENGSRVTLACLSPPFSQFTDSLLLHRRLNLRRRDTPVSRNFFTRYYRQFLQVTLIHRFYRRVRQGELRQRCKRKCPEVRPRRTVCKPSAHA